jgi:hypothetical protein
MSEAYLAPGRFLGAGRQQPGVKTQMEERIASLAKDIEAKKR